MEYINIDKEVKAYILLHILKIFIDAIAFFTFFKVYKIL